MTNFLARVGALLGLKGPPAAQSAPREQEAAEPAYDIYAGLTQYGVTYPREEMVAGAQGYAERSYYVPVVGERNYQREIGRCMAGQRVILFHEPDNPFDPKAIAVATANGSTLGYLKKDSWLHRALLNERKGCNAQIKSINGGSHGNLGIVLAVDLDGSAVVTRAYRS